ncbi:MAG: hypothetical protein CL917_15435 [Deltaproteobacteria bacterium]|nr:hypothetical protein [Deltaproteobacteria bacterium]
MAALFMSPSKPVRRHKHRSYRQKATQSIGLVLGTPILLFLILATSVEFIEYRPLEPTASNEWAAPLNDREGQDLAVHPAFSNFPAP